MSRRMDWSAEQNSALSAVSRWLKSGEPQLFRLFGFAGTGKTTLAKHIAAESDGGVVFAAFTGKAALVLRGKGCRDASTIHSLIYRAKETETDTPTFELNADSSVTKAALIIVDECSMVDADLGRDLLSFGKPILVLGDPAQLPPIKGGGFFTDGEPDVMLTQVHRQATDNPIIQLSMTVRQGGQLDYGTFGKSRIIRRSELQTELVTRSDQVLVGLNKTRRQYNARLRQLRGFSGDTPSVGEKLVCLKNNKKKGLLNGSIWTVSKLREAQRGFVKLSVMPEDRVGGKSVRINVLPQFFTGADQDIPYFVRRESDEFDYGYALTVHKAQGSQWDDVVLFDQSFAFRQHSRRWLYTGITRAAQTITIIR
jgi:ATP-dependent exoDNAse (exonuclease V) alpha subunit